MKKMVLCLLVMLIFMIRVPVSPTSLASESSWHGFKGGSGHTGYVDQKMDRTLGLQWRYFFGGDYIEPIQVWDQNLYFLDRTGVLYSLNRLESSVNYKVQVAKNRSVIGMDSSDKMVFISTGPSFARTRGEARDMSTLLTALDKATGKKVWETKYSTMMMTAPVVFSDKVYVAIGLFDTNFTKTQGGHLYCLNADDGTVLFDTQTEEFAFGLMSAYITIDTDIALLTGIKMDRNAQIPITPKLFAFDSKTGSPLWTESPTDENRTFGTPAMKEGYIYIMENPGMRMGGGGGPPGGGGRPPGGGGPGSGSNKPEAWLLKILAKTGKVEKTMHIENENFGTFSPTLAQDAIYINSFTGKIFCIDYAMEKIYWTKTYDRFSFYTELTATRNYLFTCLYDGMLLCISKEDGSIQYRYKVGNYGGIPVVSGREVFVSGDVLYCFSLDAKPLLLTEPSSLDFQTLEKGVKKQTSFRVLYTGLETLTGTITSDAEWLSPKPDVIQGNFQTFFANVDTTGMEEGKHEAKLIIETNFGRKTIEVSVTIHIPPPLPLTINITEPIWITNQNRCTITGASDPLVTVWLNGLEILADNRGGFRHSILLHEGENPLQVRARSKDNRESSLTRMVILDTIPPELEAMIQPNPDRSEEWIITGTTEPGTVIDLLDQTYAPEANGTFRIVFVPEAETESVLLTCTDTAGNRTRKNLPIERRNPE